jgi:hypothetical protein
MITKYWLLHYHTYHGGLQWGMRYMPVGFAHFSFLLLIFFTYQLRVNLKLGCQNC